MSIVIIRKADGSSVVLQEPAPTVLKTASGYVIIPGSAPPPSVPDTTAPTLSSTVGTQTSSTTATVGATTNEGNGTLYYVVTLTSTPPTGVQVEAGLNAAGAAAVKNGSQAISSTGPKTFSVTGLTASTTYYAHLMHKDAAGNRSTVVSSASFTTASTSTYLPTVASSPMIAAGGRRLVSGYAGPLFKLQRASDSAQSDFSCASSADLPDYSAISAWAGGSVITVIKLYDQSGNARDFTVPSGTIGFDLTQLANGCCPIHFPLNFGGYLEYTAGSNIFDRRNSSYFEVHQHRSTYLGTQQIMFEFASGTTIAHALYSSDYNTNTYNPTDSPVALTTTTMPRVNVSAIGLTMSASEQRLFLREQEFTSAAASTGTAPTMRIARLSGAFNWLGARSTWAIVLYPALSTADANSVLTNLRTMFSVPTVFTSRVVFQGDSIMEGLWSTNNKELVRQLSLNGTPELFNVAVGGSLLSDHYTNRVAEVEPLYTAAYGAGKCVLVIQGGTNDLAAGSTGSTVYTTMTNFISAEHTKGFKVVVADVLPRSLGFAGWTSGTETQRGNYNTLVLANGGAADQVIDLADTGTTMGAASAPADTTLYHDGLHPTTLGYTSLAPEYAAKINLII